MNVTQRMSFPFPGKISRKPMVPVPQVLLEVMLPVEGDQVYKRRVACFETGTQVSQFSVNPPIYCAVTGETNMQFATVEKNIFDDYQRWQQTMGIKEMPKIEQLKHIGSIRTRLASMGLSLSCADSIVGSAEQLADYFDVGQAWQIIDQILHVLPDKLLYNRSIQGINFFAARIPGADMSAYNNDIAQIYSQALSLSKKNLIFCLLHEIGHSTLKAMKPNDLAKMQDCWQRVKSDLFCLEVGRGAGFRDFYQKMYFDEFIADMHVVYVCGGKEFRENAKQSNDWATIYRFFCFDVFDGIEYL